MALKTILATLVLFSFFAAPAHALGCNPGTSECFNETSYRSCTEQATWGSPVDCASGKQCVLGACQSPVGCNPGERECLSITSYHACGNYAIWEPEQSCPSGWTCDLGQCLSPGPTPQCSSPGQTRCAPDGSNTVQVCSGDLQWIFQGSCQYGCSNGYCRACRPSSTRCSDDTHYQTCNSDAVWSDEAYCGKNNVCRSGSCMPDPATVCQNTGAVRCSPTNTNMLQKCSGSYLWADFQICQLGCFSSACRACSTGERSCRDSSTYYMCDSNGQWGLATSCPNGYLCFMGSCQAPSGSQCSAIGQKRCSPSTPGMTQICGSNYVYMDYVKCGQGCANGECMVCQPGTSYCADFASYKSCDKDGQFTAAVPCAAGQSCDNGKCVQAAVCTDGARQCAGNSVQVCKGGQWAPYTSCPADSSCTESEGTAYCSKPAPQPAPQPSPQPSPEPGKGGLTADAAFIGAIIIAVGVAGYFLLARKKE